MRNYILASVEQTIQADVDMKCAGEGQSGVVVGWGATAQGNDDVVDDNTGD